MSYGNSQRSYAVLQRLTLSRDAFDDSHFIVENNRSRGLRFSHLGGGAHSIVAIVKDEPRVDRLAFKVTEVRKGTCTARASDETDQFIRQGHSIVRRVYINIACLWLFDFFDFFDYFLLFLSLFRLTARLVRCFILSAVSRVRVWRFTVFQLKFALEQSSARTAGDTIVDDGFVRNNRALNREMRHLSIMLHSPVTRRQDRLRNLISSHQH